MTAARRTVASKLPPLTLPPAITATGMTVMVSVLRRLKHARKRNTFVVGIELHNNRPCDEYPVHLCVYSTGSVDELSSIPARCRPTNSNFVFFVVRAQRSRDYIMGEVLMCATRSRFPSSSHPYPPFSNSPSLHIGRQESPTHLKPPLDQTESTRNTT